MKEYIDREAVCAEIDKGDLLVGNNAEWAKEIVHRTPTADVVEVVRCKDCENYHEYRIKNEPTGWGKCTAIEMDIDLMRNDFCSYGERKEQGKENEGK